MTRAGLAHGRGRAGDPASAADAFQDLLVDRLTVLGPARPETLKARHNLARWRGEAGNATGTAGAIEALLADQRRFLGPGHSVTLTTYSDLVAVSAGRSVGVGSVPDGGSATPDGQGEYAADQHDGTRERRERQAGGGGPAGRRDRNGARGRRVR